MRIKDRKQIDALLWANAKRLSQPGWYFGTNTNLNEFEEWDKSELKILTVFLSTGETRSVSSTDLALYSAVKEVYGSRVFMDFCYFPLKQNIEVLDELNLPWVFGSVSHAPMEDYDVVFISNAIIDERVNLYATLRNSDFPVWATQRVSDSSLPLLVFGGSSVDTCPSVLGPSADGRNRSLVDLVYVGYAEGSIDKFMDVLLTAKKDGVLKNKQEITQRCKVFSFVFNPLSYEIVYDGWKIKEIKKLDPAAPDRVEFHHPDGEDLKNFVNFSHKVLHSEGNYDSIDLQISFGCGGGGVCSFCNEGNLLSWREAPLEAIVKAMDKTRSLSLATSYSSYSYNAPYHSQFIDILYEASTRFPSVSAISFRGDVMCAKPEYMTLLRYLGLQRQTLGVEGPSDRIRNGYLNKNLSWEELEGTIKIMFEYRMMQVKLFFIITGKEEPQDWDEFFTHYDRLIEMRDRMGARTSFKVSFTHLCYYANTPLAYEERRVAKMLLNNTKSLNYFIEQAKKRDLRMRFANRGKDTLVQQLSLDLGFLFTGIFEEIYEKLGFVYHRGISDEVVDFVVDAVKRRGWDINEILGPRPYDFIFPEDIIKAVNRKFLIARHKELSQFMSHPLCFPTPGKPQPGKCAGCGQCKTAEQIKTLQGREINCSKHTVDDVLVNFSMNKPRHAYRFVFNTVPRADFFNKRALAYYTVSKLIGDQHMKIHGFGNDPWRWGNSAEFPLYIGGKYFIDLFTKEPLDSALVDGLKGRNLPGGLLSVSHVFKVPLDYVVKITDYALILVSLPTDDKLLEGVSNEDYNVVPVADDSSMAVEWKSHTDPHMTRPLAKFSGGRTLVLLDFPLRSNVIKYLAQRSNSTYKKVLLDATVKALTFYSRSAARVCSCGNPTYVDVLTGKISEYCIACVGKVALSRL